MLDDKNENIPLYLGLAKKEIQLIHLIINNFYFQNYIINLELQYQ
jgi:hypothetical protein